MTHEQLVNVAIGGHFAVLGLAVFAFFKYGFRSGDFRTWFDDTAKTLNNIGKRILLELWEKLKPVFDKADSTVSSEILDAGGRYHERAVDPKRNQAYQNALFDALVDFIENNSNEMVYYRCLLSTRSAWRFWSNYLSWSILVLMILEAAIIGLIGCVDKLGGYCLPDFLIYWSILPTVVSTLSCFLALPFLLFHYGRGMKYKERYD